MGDVSELEDTVEAVGLNGNHTTGELGGRPEYKPY